MKIRNTHPTPSVTKLLWLSDLHLDRASTSSHEVLFRDLKNSDYYAAVITGDTAKSRTLIRHLEALAAACSPRSIYVVLGNHEFYGSSPATTLDQVRQLCHGVWNL